MKASAAVPRAPLFIALALVAAILPSRAAAQSTSDQPSGYGAPLTVAQATSPEFGTGFDVAAWWVSAVGRRWSGVGSRVSGTARWFGRGSAWIGSVERSGERGSKWRSPSLASARKAGR